ncbi:MAG: hypothetical protein KME26_23165 [Oscillatoria princeps RMCB-10]|nr:hypothetical protein [Oscillatoria princeps RMCB-10]
MGFIPQMCNAQRGTQRQDRKTRPHPIWNPFDPGNLVSVAGQGGTVARTTTSDGSSDSQ